MPYEQVIKDLAYTLDPQAWVSYSGKPRDFKAVMDGRRDASLKQALEQIGNVRRNRSGRRVSNFIEEPYENFMVEITASDGTRHVEYSDDMSLGDDIQSWIADHPGFTRITISPN